MVFLVMPVQLVFSLLCVSLGLPLKELVSKAMMEAGTAIIVTDLFRFVELLLFPLHIMFDCCFCFRGMVGRRMQYLICFSNISC
jgi:hypothetical protein